MNSFKALDVIAYGFLSLCAHAQDDFNRARKAILYMAVDEAYHLMQPSIRDEKACLSVGSIDGHLDSFKKLAEKFSSEVTLPDEIAEFECSVTQLKSYCDSGFIPYLRGCNRQRISSERDFRKIKGSLYIIADKAYGSL